jgi:hypothetical protein
VGRVADEVGRRAVAIGLPTTFVAVHAARFEAWIVDDAGLTFAYARSLATGAGPVVQAGAPAVEGFSNPTWLGLLVVGRWTGLFDRGTWFGVPDVVLFPKLVALVCCAGIFAGFYAIARVAGAHPGRTTFVAGTITAAVPSFVIWTTSGLENALFALLVVGLAVVLVRAAVADRLVTTRAAVLCGLLAAAAALTRPDGLIYLLAFPLAVLVHTGPAGARAAARTVLASLGAAALPLVAYLVWRLVTFDRWLPNTAIAKEQGLPGLSDLNRPVDLVAAAGWTAGLLAAVLVALVGQRPGATRTAVRLLLVPLGLALVAYAVLPPDWMALHRFSTPVWPLVALIVALGATEVLRRQEGRRRLLTGVVLGAVAVLTLTGWRQQSQDFRANATVGVCYIARNTGYTFNSYADRLGIDEGTLLAVDGGGTALTSRLGFVDLSGLTDRAIADLWADDDMAGLRDHVFEEVRPTFIRLWPGWDGYERLGLVDDARLAEDYVPVWSPPEGGGNWVRREAATDPAALAQLQADAPQIAALVDAPYFEDGLRWWCGSTLRPSAPGSDPVLDMDQAAVDG